jgi:hypothetical protein
MSGSYPGSGGGPLQIRQIAAVLRASAKLTQNTCDQKAGIARLRNDVVEARDDRIPALLW